ncbi:MFS transporter [Pseudoponticoccus marisrubri]|uniref:MFS transporter n=1 Tax=Pseudoponticoccus marisrubri TaxID=1685382 RepID=A0A0W7WHL4_9RHOB|nr:MFS transporter [Pseudoponticoccus marisrubri]KUF10139.1 MFS transporter [Pseudoponticoccus marisrubri]
MSARTPLLTPVLLVGCAVLIVSFSIRASFGVFQIPIAEQFGWLRAEFSMAIAVQNLAWGIGQPIFGALAEKIGDRRAIVLGALTYAAGLVLSSFAVSPEAHQLYEVLVGFGIAGTGFGVILAVVGRAASDEHRSMSLAIVAAAGSGGQIFGPPVAEWLLGMMAWSQVFLLFAAAIVAVLLLLPLMRAPAAPTVELEESMGRIVGRAARDPSFSLIFIGFFSCGYQLGFVTAHFPAFVTEMCGPIMAGGMLHGMGITTTSALGAAALAVIGVFNIAGTLGAGWLGNRLPRKHVLAGIYAARTVTAAVFILLPITPGSVLVFSAVMGTLWLATVPLTSGLVAHLYGLRYMGTLYGIVFFSHQLGSFLGVWLGGRFYDIYGNYTLVWWIGVAVGLLSVLVHLPIRETRPTAPPAVAA